MKEFLLHITVQTGRDELAKNNTHKNFQLVKMDLGVVKNKLHLH